jgi:hypothetical protein
MKLLISIVFFVVTAKEEQSSHITRYMGYDQNNVYYTHFNTDNHYKVGDTIWIKK